MKLIRQLEFSAPIKVISEANRPGREHWSKKRNRELSQQTEITVELHNALVNKRIELPCVVILTRVGPKKLDPDNLANSFKAVQDAIAKKLGVDDGDEEKIDWVYDQTPIGKRQYSVKVRIQSVGGALSLD